MEISTYLCNIKQRSNDAALKKIEVMATKSEKKIIKEQGMSKKEADCFLANNEMWAAVAVVYNNPENETAKAACAKAVEKWCHAVDNM